MGRVTRITSVFTYIHHSSIFHTCGNENRVLQLYTPKASPNFPNVALFGSIIKHRPYLRMMYGKLLLLWVASLNFNVCSNAVAVLVTSSSIYNELAASAR